MPKTKSKPKAAKAKLSKKSAPKSKPFAYENGNAPEVGDFASYLVPHPKDPRRSVRIAGTVMELNQDKGTLKILISPLWPRPATGMQDFTETVAVSRCVHANDAPEGQWYDIA